MTSTRFIAQDNNKPCYVRLKSLRDGSVTEYVERVICDNVVEGISAAELIARLKPAVHLKKLDHARIDGDIKLLIRPLIDNHCACRRNRTVSPQ